MDGRKKYEIYRQMFDKSQEFMQRVQEHLSQEYSKVYTVFISVGDEEKGLYFVDVEAGGNKPYFRYRGMATEEQIQKFYQ